MRIDQDPMSGLKGLQKAVTEGYQMDKVISGTAKNGVRVCSDMGGERLTFAIINKKKVHAFLAFTVGGGLYENEICFGMFYAVSVKLRGKGLTEKLYDIAIKDMKKGFSKNFYVEAIVDQDNEASNYLASKLLGEVVKQGADELSGSPVNAYYKLHEL